MKMKKWVSRHRAITGALAGVATGLVLGLINAPPPMLLAAPFVAGVVAGSVKNGAKAGILTLILPLLIVLPVSLTSARSGTSLPERPVATGIGIVDATFAALTNGLLGSVWGVMGGFGALFAGLGQVITLLVLVSIIVMVGVGLLACVVAGAAGGFLGSMRGRS